HVAVALVAWGLSDRDHRPGLRRADLERAERPDVDPGMSCAEGRGDGSLCGPRRPDRHRRSGGETRLRECKREQEGQHGRGAYQRSAAVLGYDAGCGLMSPKVAPCGSRRTAIRPTS